MSSSVVDAEFISEQITADVAFKYAIILEAVLKFKSILQLDNKYVLC
jgi:hypothetical protein